MLAGKKPAGCSYCWSLEAQGSASDRHYRSSEHWALPYRDSISNLEPNPTYVEVNFNQSCNFKCAYCSPHLSTAWEEEIKEYGPYPTSTPHNAIPALEANGLMPLKVANRDNPYVEAFWKWWPELYETLLVFRMTGGEPLMDKNTFKVLDYIAANPKGDLEIGITTNMCPPSQDLLDKFVNSVQAIENYSASATVIAVNNGKKSHTKWPRHVLNKSQVNVDTLHRLQIHGLPTIDHVPADGSFSYELTRTKACRHIGIYVSVDSHGAQAEYIRNGMNYDTLITNTKRVLYDTHMTTVNFINTFNLLSVPGLQKYLEMILDMRKYVNSLKDIPEKNPEFNNYWDRQRVWFDIPTLRTPVWLTIQNLPANMHSILDKAVEFMEANSVAVHGELIGFADFEIDKLKRNIAWMKSCTYTDNERALLRRDFYAFFREYDYRKGTNFVKTFPELQLYWKQCENSYNARA
jgi:organic radical activating enzyme